MTPLQQALEAALVENPDDVVAHMAYGDYLAERGDPRGEFVQVQLALEGTASATDERRELQRREAELLELHRTEWLGAFADRVGEPLHHNACFRRGWIDTLRIGTLTDQLARLLANATELRLLRRLTIVGAVQRFHAQNSALTPLYDAICFGNVRSFSLGDVEGEAAFRSFPFTVPLNELIRPMPRLQELHLNAVEGETAFLLHSKLPPLRVLRLERVRLGDDGLNALTFMPGLDRLKVLQIWNARFTDRGARTLALWPTVKRLDLLDVSFNWLTPQGIAVLRRTCPHVVASYQMTQADDIDNEFNDFPTGNVW